MKKLLLIPHTIALTNNVSSITTRRQPAHDRLPLTVEVTGRIIGSIL
ncbi:hypothetical protein M5X11_11250 [Paenibacillus alginolyticus]|nr:hypothetical protein [Paenibacillus alginolyticus]MCY9665533.1 hypothetical protein [Paenibacillus alginolyticus]